MRERTMKLTARSKANANEYRPLIAVTKILPYVCARLLWLRSAHICRVQLVAGKDERRQT